MQSLANAIDHLGRLDRIAANGEKIIVDTDRRNSQNLQPDFRQDQFIDSSRFDEFRLQAIGEELRQSGAFNFPGGARGYRVDNQDVTGNLVADQADSDKSAQINSR